MRRVKFVAENTSAKAENQTGGCCERDDKCLFEIPWPKSSIWKMVCQPLGLRVQLSSLAGAIKVEYRKSAKMHPLQYIATCLLLLLSTSNDNLQKCWLVQPGQSIKRGSSSTQQQQPGCAAAASLLASCVADPLQSCYLPRLETHQSINNGIIRR